MTDAELVASLLRLVSRERRSLVLVLLHLNEMDRRRIAQRHAYPSLFEYCVDRLRWAEGEAARRIQVARSSQRYPLLRQAIGRGLLSLTTAAMLAPHLARENHRRLIRSAYGRRKRDMEALIGRLVPKPEPPERARFLGVPQPPENPAAGAILENLAAAATPGATAHCEPLQSDLPRAPQRVLFSFTGDERLLAAVEKAKELLLNKYPEPGFEEVFEEGVRTLLEKLEPTPKIQRSTQVTAGDPEGLRRREPPAWVKRAVRVRDAGYCAYRATDGRRCRSRAGLQFDHIVPWALGGRSDDPANIRLLCRAHNGLEARRAFGDGAVDAAIAART